MKNIKYIRYVLIVFLLIIGVFILSNVRGNDKDEDIRGNIVIWANEDTFDYLSEAANEFMESYDDTNIEVSLVYSNNYNNKVKNAIENKSEINIVQLTTGELRQIIASNELKKDSSSEKEVVGKYSSNFSEGRMKEANNKDGIIGVPLTSRPLMLYIREDMLAEYGYTHEDINTWNDLKEVGEDISNKTSGDIKILNAVGQDYEDLVSLLVMQAMEESNDKAKIEELVLGRLNELSNIMNTDVEGKFLARISSINSMRELIALNVPCEWTANNAPAKSNGTNRFYVDEGYNLVVLNESEENSALIKKFMAFLATNTDGVVKYIKEGKFFSSYLSVYKSNTIEEPIKNFSGKSPLVVMSNIYEKAPEIEDYELYLEIKNKFLRQ